MRQQNFYLLNQLQADAEALQQVGSPLLQCQGMLVPRGMEEVRFLIKSCTRPNVSNEDPALTQMAGGTTIITAGIVKTAYTGSLTMIVTEAGHDQLLSEYVAASGGLIDCDYYDGRVDSFTRSYELKNCAIRFEAAEYDTDSRSQAMTVTCPFDYNFYGSFASIGGNGTVQAGKKDINGVADLISRVQNVIGVAQSATNTARAALGTAQAIGNLFR